ncbi:hypothetical protein PAXRUDRAFT_22149 [Paxillus rubicundulus Ve08.2h10]|uniref:Uncharacterized protein n=1 Tax=Paxillus rubicundulus Ve08.2h10 TaxID=930991 RepID=A0A0D0BKV7_9AGAM|nr:hypothetical protein PAXRUDRAFT_22149 [Paxillus rubicundulus Ve08.2h10]
MPDRVTPPTHSSPVPTLLQTWPAKHQNSVPTPNPCAQHKANASPVVDRLFH